ncbi:microfibril-associated glycoprotein 4-like [Montipora capricornis]|uniref:microfibril-associated glycoprotein 4-like n=1 Tax=Montipora capricornis TaxID=246305 RepID=UPI0035F151A9
MIRFMIIFSCSSLLFLTALAVKGNSSSPQPNQSLSSLTASSKCHNVHFNNYYSVPGKDDIKAQLSRIENRLEYIEGKINSLNVNNNTRESTKKNCAELYKSGYKISGVYTIDPDGSNAFDVYCDQKTAGGGWTVFQKRLDGSVDFIRGWSDYKRGFGNLNGEFWLGLDKIYRLTKTNSRLRVELQDMKGRTAYAEYDFFAVSSERTNYKLALGTYSGTAGDSLSYHRGAAFSTKDRDNDNYPKSCSVHYKGAAWWFNSCVRASLNGIYYHGNHPSGSDWSGINWHKWRGHSYSAKRSEMKIRPNDF